MRESDELAGSFRCQIAGAEDGGKPFELSLKGAATYDAERTAPFD
jgi:hypothetical protein